MKNSKPNIQKLADYINSQPDPQAFAAALLALAGGQKRTDKTA